MAINWVGSLQVRGAIMSVYRDPSVPCVSPFLFHWGFALTYLFSGPQSHLACSTCLQLSCVSLIT